MSKQEKKSTLAKVHPTIWVALIGGLVAVTVAYLEFGYKPAQSDGEKESQLVDPVKYAGRVVDANSLRAIHGAKVSVETQGVPQVYYTDSDGIFNLNLKTSEPSVRLRVEAANYQTFDRNVSLSRTGIEEIRLTILTITPTPSPQRNNRQSKRFSGKPTESKEEMETKKDLNYRSP